MSILRKRTTVISNVLKSPAFHASVLIVVFLSSFLWPPSNKFGTICLLRLSSGIDCPGCGLTRSFVALSHGAVLESFHYHWLGPPLYLFFLVSVINRVSRMLTKRVIFQFVEKERAFLIWSIALLLVWALRNA
jgi:Protein of unknown function (DUF2752)